MAAIDQDGTEHVARSPHSNRCVELNAKGYPCGAWAMQGSDRCYRHSVSDEEWMELSQSGGQANARRHARRRAQKELQSRGPSVPKDEHETALQQLRDSRQRLRDFYAEGRISKAELPPGVLEDW